MTPAGRGLIPDDCDDGFELDYEAILAANNVKVYSRAFSNGHLAWGLSWKHGHIGIWYCSEEIAREAAALFVYLWIKGIVASIVSQLVEAWVTRRNLETNDG